MDFICLILVVTSSPSTPLPLGGAAVPACHLHISATSCRHQILVRRNIRSLSTPAPSFAFLSKSIRVGTVVGIIERKHWNRVLYGRKAFVRSMANTLSRRISCNQFLGFLILVFQQPCTVGHIQNRRSVDHQYIITRVFMKAENISQPSISLRRNRSSSVF